MATSRRAGTGFVNLSDWARANASGTQRLADELAGGVESQGAAAQHELDTLNQDFYERLRGGTLRYDDEGLDSARAATLGQQGYGGPNGLYDVPGYETAMSRAQTAGRDAGLLNDYYGRQALLDGKYNTDGNYSTGQRLLDSALVGGAAGNRFAELKNQWGGLFSRAQDMERNAAGEAAHGRQVSDDSARRYAEAAPNLRRQELAAQYQAGQEAVRRQEEADRAEHERMAEWERRNRETNRDIDRREGIPPGPKGPRRGGAWDI